MMDSNLPVGCELSDRKKQILRSVIESHVTSGEPVGSKTLMMLGGFPFSPATIRSEMAELEALGYLEQPHTSAGRVPTTLGYRFYVDSLMEDYKLTSGEILKLNNLLKNRVGKLDTILRSASKLITSLTNYSTVSIKAGDTDTVVSGFSSMYLDAHNYLIVMRMPDGKVKTCHIRSEEEIPEQAINDFVVLLNKNIAGVPYTMITLPMMMRIEDGMGEYGHIVSSAIKSVYGELGGGETEVHFEGVDKLLEYPEFSNVDQMKKIFDMLEKKNDIVGMLSRADNDKVNIFIDDENDNLADNSALVFKKFKVGGKVVGAIGVFGPSRMDYSKVVSTMEYLAGEIASLAGDALLTDGSEHGGNN